MFTNLHEICDTSKSIADTKPKITASLDTLAQLGTNEDFEFSSTVSINDKKTLLKRARRKYFTNSLSLKLVDASKMNPDSVLTKAYWNTFHCSSVLLLRESSKVSGKYCKCRWCMVCNAIRTAVSIQKYSPVLDDWPDAHFVTLTQQTVSQEFLSHQLNEMQRIFKSICECVKRKNQRKKSSFTLSGLRKLECTYRPITNHYHPHYHVIVETKEMAEILRDEWLRRNSNAKSKGQDIRPCNKGAYKELFKYMTKVICNTGKKDDKKIIYARPLDHIFNCFRGRRVLQNFGFKLPDLSKSIKSKDIDRSVVVDILEWQEAATDWVSIKSGELITGYVPSDGMVKLLS